MCNIVLNDNLSIRLYFEKVLELVKSGEDFPVNLDDVWPLIYSDKGKAVRVLTGDNGFIKDIDYKVFTQNGKNPVGGRPTIVYMISVSCMATKDVCRPSPISSLIYLMSQSAYILLGCIRLPLQYNISFPYY